MSINNKNTNTPRANKNCSLFSTPMIIEASNTLFKIALVSIISGFDKTAIKGTTEATPIISSNAIIKIKTNKKAKRAKSAKKPTSPNPHDFGGGDHTIRKLSVRSTILEDICFLKTQTKTPKKLR